MRTWSVFAFLLTFFLLSPRPGGAQGALTLPVDSPSARFSPGNWSGDAGRGGHRWRRSWCNGAYCTWVWSTTSALPTAVLQISNPTPGSDISYFIDGFLVDKVPVPANGGVPIIPLGGPGRHTLTVFLRDSPQRDRWGGLNAFTVTGLAVDTGATPGVASADHPWVLVIGDSITEGILAGVGGDSSSLSDYAFLVGQSLNRDGYDCGVSACGYSGWLRPGDATGDVPPYYAVTHGAYSEAGSRWDKIDAATSLLDRQGHLSADGGTGQEPSAILINYGTNEALSHSGLDDLRASVAGCLVALRRAAPRAWLCVFVPFGLENAAIYPQGRDTVRALRAGIAAYQAAHPQDAELSVVDLGPEVANALASPPYGAAVHPNAAGHAFLAAQIVPLILSHLAPAGRR